MGGAGPRGRRPAIEQVLNARMAEASRHRGRALVGHAPVHVRLQVASACNLDCYMCSEHLRPPELRHARGLTSMSMELYERLEREVFPRASQLTIGVGGEPTISPHFLDYVERGHAANLELHVLTNGTQLGRARVADVVARCVSYLGISLDAASRETYERIRVGSSWERMRKNLALLTERRLAQPASSRTHLTLVFVLMKSNVHELPAFVELAHGWHAESVLAQHVIPVTEEGARESLIEEPERYARFRAEAAARARELGIELRAPAPYARDAIAGSAEDGELTALAPVALRPVPCWMPVLELFVLYDGRVFPCCHPHAHRKMQIGDLRTQSFAEIWNGTLLRNLRAGLRSGDVPPICRTCSIVHDPPPAFEDVDAILAGPDVAEHYAGRDLAPITTPAERDADVVGAMRRAGLIEHLAARERYASELERHAAELEHERERLARRVESLDALAKRPLLGLPLRVHGRWRDRTRKRRNSSTRGTRSDG